MNVASSIHYQHEPDKWAQWERLSPYQREQIDKRENERGTPLHAGSTADEIRAAIKRYHRTAW